MTYKTNVDNVTSAKPRKGGGVYSAPSGTELPTSAETELNAAFKSLGYISEDGVVQEISIESEKIKAWGGDVVNSSQTEKSVTFSYKLIEALNVDVLKEVYGPENVKGDLSSGITVKATSDELPIHPIVIDMVVKNKYYLRIVVPKAKVIEIGEINYGDADNIGYNLKIQAFPDEKGEPFTQYTKPFD